MTRLTLEQILIFNLKQKLSEGSMAYMKKDKAYLTLKKYTGQDFGDAIEKWEKWVEDNGLPFLFRFQKNCPTNEIGNLSSG